MKKIIRTILLLIVLSLAACGEEKVDILSSLYTNTIEEIDSMHFYHSNSITYSSIVNERLYEKETIFTEDIYYFKDDYSKVNTTIKEKTYENANYSYNEVEIEKYTNVLKGDAYFKKGDEFYYVPLERLAHINLISVDPIYLLDVIINHSTSYYFRQGDSTVVNDPNLYDNVVFTLAKAEFTDIVGNTLMHDIFNPYDFEVKVIVDFNKDYQITKLTFDLSDYVSSYVNYLKYERNQDVQNVEITYEIDILEYDTNKVELPTSFITLYDYSEVKDFSEFNNSCSFGDITSEVVYNSDTRRYNSSSTIKLNEDVDYLNFVVYYLSGDNLLYTSSYEMVGVKKGEELLIDYYSSFQQITDIYMEVYVNQNIYSDFEVLKIAPKYDYKGPDNSYSNPASFKDTSNEILESLFVTKVDDYRYQVNFSMQFLKTCRDLDYTLTLVAPSRETEVRYINNANFEAGDFYTIDFLIDFVPIKAYLSVEYDVSTVNRVEKHIDMAISVVEDNKSFKNYELNSNRAKVTYTSKYNSDFMNNTYSLNIETDSYINDFTAMVYFLYKGEIIDYQLISSLDDSFDLPVYNGQVDEIYVSFATKQGVGIKTGTLGIRASQMIK